MICSYRKKSPTVEAVLWDGTNLEEVSELLKDVTRYCECFVEKKKVKRGTPTHEVLVIVIMNVNLLKYRREVEIGQYVTKKNGEDISSYMVGEKICRIYDAKEFEAEYDRIGPVVTSDDKPTDISPDDDFDTDFYV